MTDLSNQFILITGATGALGQACIKTFAAAKAKLIITSRSEAALAQLAEQYSEEVVCSLSCDLSQSEAVEQLFKNIISKTGRLDAVLNVAGGFSMGTAVHELSADDFNAMFEMNFKSVMNTCKAAIPGMLKQGHGRIINVSARAAEQGKANMAPYCISKSAVVTLSECLAAEHKMNNITVNSVLPGTIDTPTNRCDMPNADFSSWVPCEDIAATMAFLCTEQARSISGASIPVYGRS
jgi:NAD(P)-dependent dehydrogenase (short-subunit alcohol dehydrogenase family)|tara:strand:- start:8464 stop:9174 length:711 start_codon:yes stop_codon:yes gene_type:complete